jgi:anthranilate synthase component 1
MLVDLGRNDLGRVCQAGSVEVTEFMQIEKYSHVMHIVSTVVGKLLSKVAPIEALFSVFPAGTLSGAPKPRAMEIIEENEPTKRGIYGGTIGYLDFTGNIDTCIAIRTAVIKNQIAYVQAGAGIVADSDPASENQECISKAAAVLGAVATANLVAETK